MPAVLYRADRTATQTYKTHSGSQPIYLPELTSKARAGDGVTRLTYDQEVVSLTPGRIAIGI